MPELSNRSLELLEFNRHAGIISNKRTKRKSQQHKFYSIRPPGPTPPPPSPPLPTHQLNPAWVLALRHRGIHAPPTRTPTPPSPPPPPPQINRARLVAPASPGARPR